MVNFTTFSGFVFLFSFTPKNGRALPPLSCMAQIRMKEKRKIGRIFKRFCRDPLATGSLEIGSFFPFFLPLGGYAISRGSQRGRLDTAKQNQPTPLDHQIIGIEASTLDGSASNKR